MLDDAALEGGRVLGWLVLDGPVLGLVLACAVLDEEALDEGALDEGSLEGVVVVFALPVVGAFADGRGVDGVTVPVGVTGVVARSDAQPLTIIWLSRPASTGANAVDFCRVQSAIALTSRRRCDEYARCRPPVPRNRASFQRIVSLGVFGFCPAAGESITVVSCAG